MMPSDDQNTSDGRIVGWIIIIPICFLVVCVLRSCENGQRDHSVRQYDLQLEHNRLKKESDAASRAFHESLENLKK